MATASMREQLPEASLEVFRRAQETAVMFASPLVGTEHFVFALAGGNDEVAAVLARAIDRDALKNRLVASGRAPSGEMEFTAEVKRAIELAFMHARRLNHAFIGVAHLALGIVESEPPPLTAGLPLDTLRGDLERLAAAGHGGNAPRSAKEPA